MIIVKIDNQTTLEKGLKILKNKVLKTKQTDILRERKEYTKKSVKLRSQKKKAIHKSKFINSR